MFAEDETGLNATNRERLARSMDGVANLRSPYKEAYCTLDLVISGPRSEDAKTQSVVKRRVESIRRWFIEHGHDPAMVLAGAWHRSDFKHIGWDLNGGLFSNIACEAQRAKRRKEIATEYSKGGIADFR